MADYKRRRIDPESTGKSRPYSLEGSDEDESFTPYVSVQQRRLNELSALQGKNLQVSSKTKNEAARRMQEKEKEMRALERIQKEKELSKTLLVAAQDVKKQKEEEEASKTVQEKQAEAEAEILKLGANRRKLASNFDLAKGVNYATSLETSWRPPAHIRRRSPVEHQRIRDKYHILIETYDDDAMLDIPPPIPTFRDMKIPTPVIEFLKTRRITAPTPIQLQGMPVAFSGRDMIGVAFTGSGKTLTFSLPLLMFAMEEEKKLPFQGGEGPVGVIVCPSRELARQTYENLQAMAHACAVDGNYPPIGILLAIGGINMAEQSHVMSRGFHIVVATPGRLQDLLEKRKFNFDSCKYLCLDEADRMIDMGFEDDVRNIMSYYTGQRQTLLFSATMPTKIRDFAQSSLIRPITVNVGRAGAANLDVIQEVEYVKQEAKMLYLLECLQKTPPPVIVFSDNKNEVDDIQEYLLLKGVEAVAIHGSKTQEEREYAIRAFKSGQKDVMVASGVASKGLDFSEIQHVINFTMPKEVEDYVHQIGRTGRSGKTGIATTFVNLNTAEETLLDLKYLLVEAKQRIPPFLASIQDPNAGSKGCTFCGGLGHTIAVCPKRADAERRAVNNQRGEREHGRGDY